MSCNVFFANDKSLARRLFRNDKAVVIAGKLDEQMILLINMLFYTRELRDVEADFIVVITELPSGEIINPELKKRFGKDDGSLFIAQFFNGIEVNGGGDEFLGRAA